MDRAQEVLPPYLIRRLSHSLFLQRFEVGDQFSHSLVRELMKLLDLHCDLYLPKVSRQQLLLEHVNHVLPIIGSFRVCPDARIHRGPLRLRLASGVLTCVQAFLLLAPIYQWARPERTLNVFHPVVELLLALAHVYLWGSNFRSPLQRKGVLVEGVGARLGGLWGVPVKPFSFQLRNIAF